MEAHEAGLKLVDTQIAGEDDLNKKLKALHSLNYYVDISTTFVKGNAYVVGDKRFRESYTLLIYKEPPRE